MPLCKKNCFNQTTVDNGCDMMSMLDRDGFDLKKANGVNQVLEADAIENHDPNSTTCCVPTECLNPGERIPLDDIGDAVRVACNNEHCNQGSYMHQDCFEVWEQTVLNYLRSCGRARGWSERQRLQNLWTKKGYDLAYKACGCKCGRGHIRKDLNWIPPKGSPQGSPTDSATKKKNRKHRMGKPRTVLSVVVPNHQGSPTSTGSCSQSNVQSPGSICGGRARANSVSSSGSSSSCPTSPTDSHPQGSPGHSSISIGSNPKKAKNESNGHGSGLFFKRSDFSTFNVLPKHQLNSYHIKMEDESTHGNDEVRSFVLNTLTALGASRVSCFLCNASMPIYDRYPLLDGAFFLSPRQHGPECMVVQVDKRTQYLSPICLSCLEGWTMSLSCKFCNSLWDGSSSIVGTMYSYDIFAARPCCAERLKCNQCSMSVLQQDQRLCFFSDYSRPVECPYCHSVDTHFVKPLDTFIRRHPFPQRRLRTGSFGVSSRIYPQPQHKRTLSLSVTEEAILQRYGISQAAAIYGGGGGSPVTNQQNASMNPQSSSAILNQNLLAASKQQQQAHAAAAVIQQQMHFQQQQQQNRGYIQAFQQGQSNNAKPLIPTPLQMQGLNQAYQLKNLLQAQAQAQAQQQQGQNISSVQSSQPLPVPRPIQKSSMCGVLAQPVSAPCTIYGQNLQSLRRVQGQQPGLLLPPVFS